jgi:hypothetical protein
VMPGPESHSCQATEAELSFLGRHLLDPVGEASLPSGRHQRGTS